MARLAGWARAAAGGLAVGWCGAAAQAQEPSAPNDGEAVVVKEVDEEFQTALQPGEGERPRPPAGGARGRGPDGAGPGEGGGRGPAMRGGGGGRSGGPDRDGGPPGDGPRGGMRGGRQGAGGPGPRREWDDPEGGPPERDRGPRGPREPEARRLPGGGDRGPIDERINRMERKLDEILRELRGLRQGGPRGAEAARRGPPGPVGGMRMEGRPPFDRGFGPPGDRPPFAGPAWRGERFGPPPRDGFGPPRGERRDGPQPRDRDGDDRDREQGRRDGDRRPGDDGPRGRDRDRDDDRVQRGDVDLTF